MRKQPKPKNSNGSIQLRFTLNGKEIALSGYGSFTDKKALAVANSYAAKLYGDYLTGNLKDLSEYSPKAQAIEATKEREHIICVAELYQAYTVYKTSKLSPKTLEIYGLVWNSLKNSGVIGLPISEKLNIKKQIVATNTVYMANLICQHLQAASKWLFSQERLTSSPDKSGDS
jgi:hypothetical protein